MERLETQALNWAAVNKLWQEERVLNGGQHGYYAGCNPGSSFVSRRSNSLMAPQRAPERWKGVNLVRLPGWSRPKTVTFVLGLRSSTSPSSKESSYELSPGEGKGKDMVDYAHHLREDWTDVSESVDSLPPFPSGNLAQSDECVGVHRLPLQDSGSPLNSSFQKSPVCSPLMKPISILPSTERMLVDLESGSIGDEIHSSCTEFEDNAAEFDRHEIASIGTSSMSTDHDFGVGDLDAYESLALSCVADLQYGT